MKIDDKRWKRLKKQIKELDGSVIQIGAIGDHADTSLTNAELLVIHEFGSEKAGIPARMPIRRTFRDSKNLKIIKKNIEGLIRKNFSIEKGLNIDKILNGIGVTLSTMVKATISRRVTPANKEATLLRKKGDLPLVNTRQLINSIDYGIKK